MDGANSSALHEQVQLSACPKQNSKFSGHVQSPIYWRRWNLYRILKKPYVFSKAVGFMTLSFGLVFLFLYYSNLLWAESHLGCHLLVGHCCNPSVGKRIIQIGWQGATYEYLQPTLTKKKSEITQTFSFDIVLYFWHNDQLDIWYILNDNKVFHSTTFNSSSSRGWRARWEERKERVGGQEQM